MDSKSTLTKCLIEPIPPPRLYYQSLPYKAFNESTRAQKSQTDGTDTTKSDWVNDFGHSTRREKDSAIYVTSRSLADWSVSEIQNEGAGFDIVDESNKISQGQTRNWNAQNKDSLWVTFKNGSRIKSTAGERRHDSIQEMFGRFLDGLKRR